MPELDLFNKPLTQTIMKWTTSALTAIAVSGVQAAEWFGPHYPNQNEFPDCGNGPLKDNDICNTDLDPITRAKGLVSAMTRDEKIVNVQHNATGVPRLGLAPYNWWSEALHGVAESPAVVFEESGDFSSATSFPQPILMGAAFDDKLIFDIATVVGTEARAFGNNQKAGLDFWTPNINPYRDPRWGRGQETPGEDPYHLQNYVYSLLSGLEGPKDEPYKRIVATCKHYAGYDLENWNGITRHEFDAQISTQDLSEFYTPSFRTCARDAKVGAFMCTYNMVNGMPTCGNPYFLDTLLRDHWNWRGIGNWVTGDCGAVEDIYKYHNYTKDAASAAALALNAGTDLDCGETYPEGLPAAFDQDQVKESTLDQALVRLYSSLVHLGYFDPEGSQKYRRLGWSDVNQPHAQELAYKAAVEGIVLLKNDGFLPVKPEGQKVAVVGPWSQATGQMQGNYLGVAPFLHSPLYGAQQQDWQVSQANGTFIQSTNRTGFDDAISAAKDADVIFYVGGIDNTIELEGLDRMNISWPQNQLDLIDELTKLDKKLVVVQMGGGQLDDTPLKNNDKINAILWGGYPGQDGGVAIFDIITGKAAPAGRLPVTQYPAEYADQVPMTDMSLRPSDSNPGRTYRWYDKAVYQFGYGLHYTDFEVSFKGNKDKKYKVDQVIHSGKKVENLDQKVFDTFKVEVENKGDVTSDYVALAFIKTDNAGPAPYPLKTLAGYTRAFSIHPGEKRKVDIDVPIGQVARVDEKGNRVLYPGDYTLEIDVDGANGGASVSFSVSGDPFTIEEFPQPDF